jgi:hypothetical protein
MLTLLSALSQGKRRPSSAAGCAAEFLQTMAETVRSYPAVTTVPRLRHLLADLAEAASKLTAEDLRKGGAR